MDWALAAARLESSDDATANDDDLVVSIQREVGHVRHIGDIYAFMMADQISIRQFPCGAEQSPLCVAGTLLTRPGFLQEEREALFGKYGSALSDWTMVCQVATLPRVDHGSAALPIPPQADASGAERRMFFEDLAVFGMATFEEQGFVEAPAFPAIHVTPLAVYREVPTSPRSLDRV
jgi:hypothetical protein